MYWGFKESDTLLLMGNKNSILITIIDTEKKFSLFMSEIM